MKKFIVEQLNGIKENFLNFDASSYFLVHPISEIYAQSYNTLREYLNL